MQTLRSFDVKFKYFWRKNYISFQFIIIVLCLVHFNVHKSDYYYEVYN